MAFGFDKKDKLTEGQRQVLSNMQATEAAIHQKVFELGQRYYEEHKDDDPRDPVFGAYIDELKKLEENYKGFYKAKLSFEGMMLCEQCEAVIPAGSVFCSKCGKRADGRQD